MGFETGLSPQIKYFTDRSKAVLFLWIFYVFFSVWYCYAFVRVCLFEPCGNLLGKGCITVSFSLFHLYPGSGDCINPDLCTLTYFGTIIGLRR